MTEKDSESGQKGTRCVESVTNLRNTTSRSILKKNKNAWKRKRAIFGRRRLMSNGRSTWLKKELKERT